MRVVGRILLAGLALALLGVIGTVALVAPLRVTSPHTTAFMERAAAGGTPVHYRWVDWREISPHLPVAVLTAEDQRFPEHRGFDLESIRKALDEGRERTRGASTITQQPAKNLFLWPERSLARKGLEAWFTLCLEALLPKQRILELYLNVAEFGPGVYGVGAASERLFGKQPSELTSRDAALLTAVLPSPSRMHADRPSEYVESRVAEIEYATQRWGHRLRKALGLPPAPMAAPTEIATAYPVGDESPAEDEAASAARHGAPGEHADQVRPVLGGGVGVVPELREVEVDTLE